jgi:hypothetical protein
MRNYLTVLLVSALFLSVSCKKKKEEEEEKKDDFNKSELLANYSSNIIIPSYQDHLVKLDSLLASQQRFASVKNLPNLLDLRQKFADAYLSFQNVSAFEFGPAETVYYRSNANTFPCDTPQIKSNVASGTYDLNTAANIDAKGFPALDFMLYGKNQTDQQVLDLYVTDSLATNRLNYLGTLCTTLRSSASGILQSWTSSYQSTFNASTSSDIGSSIGLLINQLNQDVEISKNFRIGVPLGKKTLGVILPDKCEAYYSKQSLELVKKNILTCERIYFGNSLSGASGKGFDDYLDFLNAQYNGGSLNAAITNQFTVVKTKLNAIPETLDGSIVSNFAAVDAAYLEVQRLVVLLKADMPSALGIVITYQDTDGD